MTKDEALKLALEALERMKQHSYLRLDYAEQAITAIKEALAQPEQEPIAKVCHDLDGHIGWNPTAQVNEFPEGMELFAAPLPVQPERQWVGLTDEELFEIMDKANTRYQAMQMTAAKLKVVNGFHSTEKNT